MIKIVNLLKNSRFWLISCISVSLIAQSCSVDLGNEENFVKKEAIDRAEKLESLVENENTPVIFGELDEEFGLDLPFDDEIRTYAIVMIDIDHIPPQAKKKIKISFTNNVASREDVEFQMYALDESGDMLLDSAVSTNVFWSGSRTAFIQADTDLQQNTEYVIKASEDTVIESVGGGQFTEGPISNIRFKTDFKFEPNTKLSIQYTENNIQVLNNDALYQSNQGIIINSGGSSPNIELSLDFRTGSLARILSIKIRNVKVDGTSEENKVVNLCAHAENCADVTAVENGNLTSVPVSLTGNLAPKAGHNIYVAEVTDHKSNVYHRIIKFQYGLMRKPEEALDVLPGSMRILLTSDGGLDALGGLIESYLSKSSLGKDQTVSEFMDESFRINHLTWEQYMMGLNYNGGSRNDGTVKSSIDDIYVKSTAAGGNWQDGNGGCSGGLVAGYAWSKLYGPYCGANFRGRLRLPSWMGSLTAAAMASAVGCMATMPWCAILAAPFFAQSLVILTISADLAEISRSGPGTPNGKTNFQSNADVYIHNMSMPGYVPSTVNPANMVRNTDIDLKHSSYTKAQLQSVCNSPATDQEFVFRKFLDCEKIRKMVGTNFLGIDLGFKYLGGEFLLKASNLHMPVGTKFKFGSVTSKIPYTISLPDANSGRDSSGRIRTPIRVGIVLNIEDGNLVLYPVRNADSISLKSIRLDLTEESRDNFDTIYRSDSDFREEDLTELKKGNDHDKIARFIMTYNKIQENLGYDLLKMDHFQYFNIDSNAVSIIERKGVANIVHKVGFGFIVDAILDAFTKSLSKEDQFGIITLGSVTYSLVTQVMSKFLNAVFIPFQRGEVGINFSSYLPAPFNKASASIMMSFQNMGIFSKAGGSSGLEASINGALLARNGHLFTDNGRKKEDLTGLVPNLPKYVSAAGIENKSTFLTVAPGGLPFGTEGSESLVNAGFTTNAVALSPDVVNQMLYSLWREGVFNIDYDSNFSDTLSIFSHTPVMRDLADGLLVTGQLLPVLDPFRAWEDFKADRLGSLFGPETVSPHDTMMFRIKFFTPPTLTTTLAELREDVPIMNIDFGDGAIEIKGRREDGSIYHIVNIRLGMKAKTKFSISYFSNPKNISAMDKFVAFKLGLLKGKENFQYVVSVDDGQQANPMKLDPTRVKSIVSAIIPDVVVPILDSVMSELPLQRLDACGMQFQNMAIASLDENATEPYIALTFDSNKASYDNTVTGLNCGIGDSSIVKENEVGAVKAYEPPSDLTLPTPVQAITFASSGPSMDRSNTDSYSYAKACHLEQESISVPAGESNIDLRSFDVTGGGGEVITTIDYCQDNSYTIDGETISTRSIKTEYADSRRAHCTENNGDFSISSDYEYFCTTQNVVQSACSGTFTQTSAPGVVPSTSTCQVDISTTDMPARLVL